MASEGPGYSTPLSGPGALPMWLGTRVGVFCTMYRRHHVSRWSRTQPPSFPIQFPSPHALVCSLNSEGALGQRPVACVPARVGRTLLGGRFQVVVFVCAYRVV